MLMRAAVIAALLGLLAACRRADAPVPANDLKDAAIAPLASTGEVDAAGLLVRTGSLTATGGAVGALWGFSDLSVDLRRLRLEVVPAPGGATLASLLPPGALAVVNGGYFEADFRPSTWLKNAGLELSHKSDTSKGGVLALSPGSTYVGSFAGLSFDPELAIQSFPLLVEPDFKPGIHSDDGRRAARTVVCLAGDLLHIVVLAAPRGEGPTLFETATLMRATWPAGFGCRVALNLDGGPSTGVVFGPAVPAKSRLPASKVGYALAVLPR